VKISRRWPDECEEDLTLQARARVTWTFLDGMATALAGSAAAAGTIVTGLVREVGGALSWLCSTKVHRHHPCGHSIPRKPVRWPRDI
jgi:hypothetical protein